MNICSRYKNRDSNCIFERTDFFHSATDAVYVSFPMTTLTIRYEFETRFIVENNLLVFLSLSKKILVVFNEYLIC